MATISRRTFLRRVTVGAGALTLFSTGGFTYVNAAAGTPVFTLRILHVNDHHAHIEPIAETNFTPVRNHGGVSRRKTYIDTVRASVPAEQGFLLLDAGDVFQGTLYYNQYKGYADLDFYRRMGIQAVTIGNHEFDDGPANLAKFIDGATTGTYPTPPAGVPALAGTNFPVISANITVTAASPLNGKIQPSTVINVTAAGAARKIGVFGLTTPDTAELSSPGPTVTFTEPNAAATAAITALQGQSVNGIIGLTHIGYGADVALAQNTKGVYLIIGGHSHTPLGPQPAAGGPYPTIVTNLDGEQVLVLTDWEWGRWIGDLSVSFDANGKVAFVSGTPVELVADPKATTGYIAPNPDFETLIGTDTTGYKAAIAALSNTPVGSSTVGLDGTTAVVRSRETNLGNLIADAILAKVAEDAAQVDYPSVAITNGGGIRASINAGSITYGNVLTVLPFGNTIARVDLTGAQLRQAISTGLDRVGAASGSGRFPVVGNLRYAYTTNRPEGQRLKSLEVKTASGYAPVSAAGMYRVYTNNFMLVGGDGYVTFTQGTNKLDVGFILADALAEYIAANSPLDNSKIALGRVIAEYLRWLPSIARTVPVLAE